jgi:alcohol dehydrogenase class IV
VISPFSFKSLPAIIFGSGVRSQISQSVVPYGGKTLLVTGGKSFINSNHFQELQEQLARHKVDYHTEHISNEPSPEVIDEIVARSKNEQIDSVVAIGGGSVLDAGKAISAMLQENGSVTQFLEGVGDKEPSGKKLPFIAVPTTSGTGSEATSNAVLSVVGPKGFKKSLRHDNYIPNIAIVDPELTLSCPPALTAACGMDCFTQLVEAYLSTNSSALTDTFALQGIEAIARSLTSVFQQGNNIDARNDLSYAAMLSGVVLANAGLGTVHGFASAIGGVIPAAHGIVCGTLMEPCNRLTLSRLRKADKENPALDKYTTLGRTFSSEKQKSDSWYQDYFIDSLAEISNHLGIPDLTIFKITEAQFEKILSDTGNKYNPVQLDRNDLETILKSKS